VDNPQLAVTYDLVPHSLISRQDELIMLKLKPNCLLSVRIKDEFVQKSDRISVSFGRKPFDETRILFASLEVLARESSYFVWREYLIMCANLRMRSK
jgi:hypothetical protein